MDKAAAQLANSAYFKFILSFHMVCSSAGMIGMFVVEYSKKKILAHKSLVLLMDMHSFWTFLLCMSVLHNSSLTLHTHLTMRNHTDILVTASTCKMRRTPLMIASYGSIISQMAMAAERYRASNNLANYEHSGRSSGHALNAAHLTIVLLVWCVHFFSYGSDRIGTHCLLVTPDGGLIHIGIAVVLFLCELVTIVSFRRLLSRNCAIRDSEDTGMTLSERYQLTENIRMLKLLNPIIWSHTSLGLIGGTIFFAFKLIMPATEMYPLIEESVNMLYLQGVCIPFIVLFRSREEGLHQKELLSVNKTKGAALASHHARVIMTGW